MLGVGARCIQLIGSDARRMVERLNDPNVVAYLVAKNVGNAGSAGMGPQRRKLFLDESLDPNVLQADSVDHATRGLNQPRGLISGHGLERKALGDKAANAVDGNHIFKFHPIAKSSTGSNDRVA